MSSWFLTYGFADVLPDLLVGAYPLDAADVHMLSAMGVREVLNLAEDEEYGPGDRERVIAALAEAGIEEQRVSIEDHGNLPAPALEEAVEQVNRWLDAGLRSYVHCRAGWQRSSAVAAGVVALREGLSIEDALKLMQSRKPAAEPLPHQLEDLNSWWEQRQVGAEPPADPSG